MTRSETRTIILIVVIIAVFASIIGLTIIADHFAHGQTQQPTSTTTPTPPPVDTGINATEGTSIAIGGAAGLIAIVKGVLDQRKNTKRDRTTDVDAGRFIVLMSKFYQAKYLYPYMTDKEILDLPISNNPMSKMSLGQAITSEAELWANGNQQYWGIPSPQMSVPTLTTVEAINKSEPYPKVVTVDGSSGEKSEKSGENKEVNTKEVISKEGTDITQSSSNTDKPPS